MFPLLALAVVLLLLAATVLAAIRPSGQALFSNRPVIPLRGPLRVGKNLLSHTSAYSYSPIERELNAINRIDADGDGVEDYLESLIESGNITGNVSVIVFFAARPGALGGDTATLAKGLKEVMEAFSDNGGFGFKGPWVNVLVGFSVKVPVKAVEVLGSIVKSFDIEIWSILDFLDIIYLERAKMDQNNFFVALKKIKQKYESNTIIKE
jgi:hypothetical protein